MMNEIACPHSFQITQLFALILLVCFQPDFLPEIHTQLEHKIHEIMKTSLQISREIPVTKIARMISGPEVRARL